jgi:hypothetical protein
VGVTGQIGYTPFAHLADLNRDLKYCC